MLQGIETGRVTFDSFLTQSGWTRGDIRHTFCHQVGSTHRKLMLESIEMSPERDFVTFPLLGNTGSAALPVTIARAIEEETIRAGDRVAMLGIGSGINCLIAGASWQTCPVLGREQDTFADLVTAV